MSVFDAATVVKLASSAFTLRAKPQLKELFLFELLFSFAFALVTVFEPVFFYQEGFSLSIIALYYALHYSLYAIVLPWGGMFASRFGVERSISLSLPIFVLYFLTLAAIPSYPSLFYLALVLLTAHKMFYWPAFNANFAAFGDKKNSGTELSWFYFLKYGVGILGPLLGGFIAANYGFPMLFTLAAVLVFCSAIPMLLTVDGMHPRKASYNDPWKIIRSRRDRHMILSMVGWGENLVDLVFWPIFLFIGLGTTQLLGIVISINSTIMTMFSFVVGELSDRFSSRTVIRLHLPFMILGYFLRPFARFPLAALLTEGYTRLAYTGVNLATTHRLYLLAARRKDTINYMVAAELTLAIVKALLAFGLVVVFALFLPYQAFWIAFIAAAVLALFYAAL